MGRRYDQPGEEQALAILHDLASAPATAQHIGGKLARHFVADNPPPDVSDRLASAFERSDGDLPTVYRTLIDMREAWSPVAVKFKTPWEWTISSMRGLGWQDLGKLQTAPILTQLGQPVWRPGSPAGYDDIAASWAAPDALVRRVEVAQRFASRVGDRLDARSLGQTLLAGSLSAPTATAVSRADSASTAIALLLVYCRIFTEMNAMFSRRHKVSERRWPLAPAHCSCRRASRSRASPPIAVSCSSSSAGPPMG